MSRYGWVKEEMASIPRRTFHVLEKCSLADLADIERRYGELPGEYREFVMELGRAQLIRAFGDCAYYLMVYVPPRAVMGREDEGRQEGTLVRIKVGYRWSGGDAWFEWEDGRFAHGGGVCYGMHPWRRRIASSFEEWFRRSFLSCRRFYTKKEWDLSRQPARPFDDRERAVVEALQQFRIRMVGVTSTGEVQVEVENGSKMELPYLTIGVRGQTGMEGRVPLRTAGIGPGTKAVVEREMYREVPGFREVTLFPLPRPDPEDREMFWELNEEKRRWLEEGQGSGGDGR